MILRGGGRQDCQGGRSWDFPEAVGAWIFNRCRSGPSIIRGLRTTAFRGGRCWDVHGVQEPGLSEVVVARISEVGNSQGFIMCSQLGIPGVVGAVTFDVAIL